MKSFAQETGIFKEMIDIIRNEERRRASLLTDEALDAHDHWSYEDEPFVNRMCLMLLVGLRHQVERGLVGLAARAAEGGREISGQQYKQNIENLRKEKGIGWKWKNIEDRLSLKDHEAYKSVEVLRFLANSYKHDPSMAPDKTVLEQLGMETGIKYDSLPESSSLRAGLASAVDLDKSATYCEISDRFLRIAADFLAALENNPDLSEVRWGPVSLSPKEWLH
jgi:hypothetical protein